MMIYEFSPVTESDYKKSSVFEVIRLAVNMLPCRKQHCNFRFAMGSLLAFHGLLYF